MSIELKIKSKHLSEEARIIRFEEQKLLREARRLEAFGHVAFKDKARSARAEFVSIQQHRKEDVRNEQRATFLARAFLAGKRYLHAERKTTDNLYHMKHVLAPRIVAMANKYRKDKWRRDEVKSAFGGTVTKVSRNADYTVDDIMAWIRGER